MATAEDVVKEREKSIVLTWREDQFRRMGFKKRQARVLAASDADLHTAVGMLKRGCDAETAFDILS
jgi:hypothetical protein